MKAVVRDVPQSYPDLYSPKGISVDLNLAKTQHKEYVKALRWLGLTVDVLPADEKFPDCTFVEDCAVIHNDKALITNMGSDYRRGEIEEVKSYFKESHKIIEMKPPAKLEGGDVLVTDHFVYVGVSQVSNKESLHYLKNLFSGYEIVPIPVTKTLHLKTACSYIGRGILLICPDLISKNYFNKLKLISIPKDECYAANCIYVNNKIVVPLQAKKAISILENEGFDVRPIDISEFAKGEGSLTCLSIIY